MPEQESSQEHEYHPAVEEIMETSGQNVGRIKDQDAARRVAQYEDDLRNRGDKENQAGEFADQSTKSILQGKAWEKKYYEPEVGDEKGAERQEARRAGESYDQLQMDAAEAREKIDEARPDLPS